MTTNSITDAARTEAARRDRDPSVAGKNNRAWFVAGAEWQAAQEATDAEVLAALNAQGIVMYPKMHPAPSLDYWGDKPAEAMRAALSAARAARRDEEQ